LFEHFSGRPPWAGEPSSPQNRERAFGKSVARSLTISNFSIPRIGEILSNFTNSVNGGGKLF